MVVGMRRSRQADAGGGDLRRLDLRLPAGLINRLSDVIDGGSQTDADKVCGLGLPGANDLAVIVNYRRAAIGPAAINAQPEMSLMNRLWRYRNNFGNHSTHKLKKRMRVRSSQKRRRRSKLKVIL
jgi:hypothetical protein